MASVGRGAVHGAVGASNAWDELSQAGPPVVGGHCTYVEAIKVVNPKNGRGLGAENVPLLWGVCVKHRDTQTMVGAHCERPCRNECAIRC